jgi:signal peptidase I
MADPVASPRIYAPRTAVAGVLWCLVVFLTLLLTGCPRFSLYYTLFLVASIAVLAGSLYGLNAICRRGRLGLVPGFRKAIGYAIVVLYVLQALPRAGWETDGLITDQRAVFLYAMTLATVLTGLVFWLFLRLDRAFPRPPRMDRKAKAEAKSKEKRSVVAIILDWVDALASAVVAVLLIETFLFQLYQVPTESMVPVFLGGDRPFTLKLDAGPRLPLTEWRLPFLRQPARGDVVTIANPRYPENSGVNLKKYLSQMVYMVTFTLVNIDTTAADGTPKADPLVKRIVGLPGEKLMMVDDVLYARTAADSAFHPVAPDRNGYAQVDLWSLPPATRARIRDIRANEQTRAELTRWDTAKNTADAASLAAGLRARWERIASLVAALPGSALSAFEDRQLPRANATITTLRDEALAFLPAGASNPVALLGADAEDFSLALAVCRSSGTRAALKEYALAGLAPVTGPTPYEVGSHALNLLVKTNLLDRVIRDIGHVAAGATLETILADATRNELTVSAKELALYLDVYYDARNFPVFPSGNAYLGPDQYFAMGDNRYNSLDFRFAETSHARVLDPSDGSSIVYASILEPFALEKRSIEGYAIFRVWPPNRLGLIE